LRSSFVSTEPAASASYAQMAIDARSFHASVRLPLDEMDLLLRLDRDLDGEVSAAELEAGRERVAAYVARHLHVAGDGQPVPLSVNRLALWRDAGGSVYLEAEAGGQSASRVATVSIRSDFLTELDPAHTTRSEIRIRDRTDAFVFQAGALYERRVGADRLTSMILVLAGLLVIGALWVARRRSAMWTAAALLVASLAHADVIMSAPALNATLKAMERLTREIDQRAGEGPRERVREATFRLGVEADALASLMNREVESHGMQERELLDLALSRTKELGVAIAYNREKKKFFYDGAAFTEYLKDSPRGTHAAAAEFMLLSYQFYQTTTPDIAALTAAADAKQRFLTRYPRFSDNAEVRLYLAVDYRDLSRQYRAAGDTAGAGKYQRLSRAECQRILRLYPGTEQATAARQILRSSS
jgi:hypothetical protein